MPARRDCCSAVPAAARERGYTRAVKWMLTLLLLAFPVAAAAAAGAKAPVAPIYQQQLPPECRERDADPEKCVIDDGPPDGPIRKKPAASPPSRPVAPKPPVQEPRDGGTRR